MDEKTLIDVIAGLLERYGLAGAATVLAILALLFPDRVRAIATEFKSFRRPVKDVDLTVRRINQCITTVLQSLLQKYDADRCYVFEFEDYDERVKPLPWLYCSCTYEVCHKSRGVNCEAATLQKLPLAAIPYWQRELGTVGEICLHSVDDLKSEDLESWKILARQQISSVYCFSLFDFRGVPIGFLGLDYCDGHESMLTAPCELKSFTMEVAKIAGLLAMKKNGSLQHLAGTL